MNPRLRNATAATTATPISKASTEKPVNTQIIVKPPNFGRALFTIIGSAPLVIHRFSQKVLFQMKAKMEAGSTSRSKKIREAKSTDSLYNEARYISREGWDGFNAASVRNAMITACSLIGYKMTMAKMSIFVLAEGRDKLEPQIPLIRIWGRPIKQEDMARVETGSPYVTVRPAYHNWRAKIALEWDKDQFTLQDVTNLLMRAGKQVGIGEGRPASKNSAGCGWGTFELERAPKQLAG